ISKMHRLDEVVLVFHHQANLSYGTGLAACILVLRKHKAPGRCARHARGKVVDPTSVVYTMDVRSKQESIHHAHRAYLY
ncbi:MAG: SAM-dependent methyltransferase, partial [Beggiatoa sp.]|nr:SAM-dependent methyltransferase [Beggiatoa sp.]